MTGYCCPQLNNARTVVTMELEGKVGVGQYMSFGFGDPNQGEVRV